jgi:hypothetical protein
VTEPLTVWLAGRLGKTAHRQRDCVHLANRPAACGAPQEVQAEPVHGLAVVRVLAVSGGRVKQRTVALCSRCG